MRSECVVVVLGLMSFLVVGLNTAEAAIKSSISHITNMRIQQCRGGCLEKFAIREALCQQRPECSTSGFPPYNYNSLPDALHLLCWDECAKPPPPKINKSILETWALRTVSMLQQDSLVLVDVAWAPLNTPNQCLVTWEVSGGGLMGNLLTESSNVQLSLWPETKYRVQVTCKNKLTGAMSRSLPLAIDTAEAVPALNKSHESSTTITSPALSPIPITTSSSSSSSSAAAAAAAVLPENGLDEDNLLGTGDSFTILRYRTMKENLAADVTVDKMHRDLNMIAIKSLSDMHKPLLFGVVAATLLLALVLCLYVFTVRNQRIPSDKKALIDDDGNSTVAGSANAIVVSGTTNHFGSGPPMDGMCVIPPIDPSLYSRTVHVLTV